MAFPLPAVFKRIAFIAAISRLAEPRRRMMDEPEAVRRPMDAVDRSDDFLFDATRTEVDDRVGMLASEMSRLSNALGGVRSMLGVIAADAPLQDAAGVSTAFAALHEDAMLFDGEPAFAGETTVAMGEIDYLFDETEEPVSQDGAASISQAA